MFEARRWMDGKEALRGIGMSSYVYDLLRKDWHIVGEKSRSFRSMERESFPDFNTVRIRYK